MSRRDVRWQPAATLFAQPWRKCSRRTRGYVLSTIIPNIPYFICTTALGYHSHEHLPTTHQTLPPLPRTHRTRFSCHLNRPSQPSKSPSPTNPTDPIYTDLTNPTTGLIEPPPTFRTPPTPPPSLARRCGFLMNMRSTSRPRSWTLSKKVKCFAHYCTTTSRHVMSRCGAARRGTARIAATNATANTCQHRGHHYTRLPTLQKQPNPTDRNAQAMSALNIQPSTPNPNPNPNPNCRLRGQSGDRGRREANPRCQD